MMAALHKEHQRGVLYNLVLTSQMTAAFHVNVIMPFHLHKGGKKGFAWGSEVVLACPQIWVHVGIFLVSVGPTPRDKCKDV